MSGHASVALSYVDSKLVKDPLLTNSIFENTVVERWASLPLSLIGRINILKMNVLPNFLYLFQNIPITPPSNLFSRLKKLIIKFIRNNRRSRIRLSLLYLPFDMLGGFNLYLTRAMANILS